MEAFKTFKHLLVGRTIALLCAGTSTFFFGFILSTQLKAVATGWVWNCLPLVGLGISLAWNLFSFLVLCTGSYFLFSRRFHLLVELATSFLVVSFGYISFVYSFIKTKEDDSVELSTTESRMNTAGIVFLSVAFVAHFVFFCYGSYMSENTAEFDVEEMAETRFEEKTEEQTEVARSRSKRSKRQRQSRIQWNNENPFDGESRSSASLSAYDWGDLAEVPCKVKKQSVVTVVELDDTLV